MTGLNPFNHSIDLAPGADINFNLPSSLKTLPELLRNAGYETHMVGKWHLGFWKEEFTPTFRGFNSFYGFYCRGEDGVSMGYDFRREDSPRCGKNCSIVEDVIG